MTDSLENDQEKEALSLETSTAEKQLDSETAATEQKSKEKPSEIQSDEKEMKPGKPFYKKWWFWVIVVLILIIVVGSVGGESTSSSNTTSNSNVSTSSSSASNTNMVDNADDAQEPLAATDAEKADLKASIDESKAMDMGLYTSDSAELFTDAISEAEDIYSNPEATSDEVKNAIDYLATAKALLEEKVQPVVLTGNGDDVVDIPEDLAVCLVSANYEGGSNFVIKSLDASGNSLDLLVNTIGAYTGTTTTGLGRGTAAMLEINASGPWTITLKPIADADALTSGQVMHGDNVVLADTSGATKLNITNNGESNFVVRGISTSSSELLVNEIGSYSGTVVNKNYIMFIVGSKGDWTISW